MRKSMLALMAAMLLISAHAFAQDTYVFPGDGFRYTQMEDETVLTRSNLAQHQELITSLGTTADAIRASYAASGIVMEAIPRAGGQIALSVAMAEESDAAEMKDLDDNGRDALLARFQESGLYETCDWAEDPQWLRMTASAMYGSMPVWQLRYTTLHLSRFYTLTSTIVGREPEEADENRLLRMIRSITFLSQTSLPTPSPSPAPTQTPSAAVVEAPKVAEVRMISEGLELDEAPGTVTQQDVTLTGRTEPSQKVTAQAGGKTLSTATSDKDGRFTLKCKLPSEGENTLHIKSGKAEAELTILYQMEGALLTITEPADSTFTGDRVLVRGVTEPNATVYVTGERTSTNVKANKNGVFTAPIFMYEPGTRTYTLRARIRGKADTSVTVTLTRVLTEREELAQFKATQVAVTYAELAANPTAYRGKNFVFRGKVMSFTDYDGQPCALVCVSNPRTGVWQDPLYAVLSVGDDVKTGDVLTFYLVGEGLTLPAPAQYTADGKEQEAPAARVFRFTENR